MCSLDWVASSGKKVFSFAFQVGEALLQRSQTFSVVGVWRKKKISRFEYVSYSEMPLQAPYEICPLLIANCFAYCPLLIERCPLNNETNHSFTSRSHDFINFI